MCSSPRPAPKRHSAQAAALASFSTMTGKRSRELSASRSGSPRQLRCGAKSTVERSASTQPAAPMPTAWTSCRSASSSTSSTMTSSTTLALLDLSGVSVRSFSSTLPSPSTTPATTLVPPMSTPMVGSRSRPTGRARRRRSARGPRPNRAGRTGGRLPPWGLVTAGDAPRKDRRGQGRRGQGRRAQGQRAAQDQRAGRARARARPGRSRPPSRW